jgi:hypothetical protein
MFFLGEGGLPGVGAADGLVVSLAWHGSRGGESC